MSPRRLPPTAQLARWAVKYGPLVLPYAKRLYEQGRFRQLALMHARTLEDGTFSWEVHDGERIWVVWTGDEVVETYPDRPDLADADGHPFPSARPDRRQRPEDVPTQRARRRLSELPGLGRSSGADPEAAADAEVDAENDASAEDPTSAAEAQLHDDDPRGA